MLPFTGTATVAYLPGERVVGLSKLGRVVQTFARRLQVQERMTQQIADAVTEHLAPVGVAVLVSGSHQCMAARGVALPDACMTTAATTGELSEFHLATIRAAHQRH